MYKPEQDADQRPDVAESAISILVGTPCAQGGLTAAYFHSMTRLRDRCAELGWSLQVRTREDGLVNRTRNIFGSQMVRSEQFTHLLMVDADIGFGPGVVERLVNSEHDVVGACVPLRQVRWDAVRDAIGKAPDLTSAELESIAHRYAVTFFPKPDNTGSVTPVDGFVPARFVGGAMLLARREAFLRLSESDLVTYYARGGNYSDWEPDGWTFFDPLVDPDGSNYLSEDYAFCHRWRAWGGTVWADLRSQVTHNGTLTVAGDVAQTLRTAARLVSDGSTPADHRS
ncbi:MAG: hypothetical protein WCP28_13365 [Actinomycetes bacterium]